MAEVYLFIYTQLLDFAMDNGIFLLSLASCPYLAFLLPCISRFVLTFTISTFVLVHPYVIYSVQLMYLTYAFSSITGCVKVLC